MSEEVESGLESTESGAVEGASSDASESGSETGAPAQAAAPKQEETAPFHEHPRFKELVEQKNEAQRQYQAIQAQYKAMEQQINSLQQSQPKAPTETDQLLADLKKVDPRLAKVIESQLKASETAQALQTRLDQFESSAKESAQQQTVTNAVSKINSLHETNKTSDFGKQFINNQLDLAYRAGKIDASDLKAVEAAYQQAHSVIKTYEDTLKRTITESYVQSKKTDAGTPTSLPKGPQAKPAAKPLNVPKDKESLKSAVVKSFMKEQAASRDATNA